MTNEIDFIKAPRDTFGKGENKSTQAEWRKQGIHLNPFGSFSRQPKARLKAININEQVLLIHIQIKDMR